MLEFFVLGQIPGTHIVLTLPWIVAIAVITGGMLSIHHEHKHHNHMAKETTS